VNGVRRLGLAMLALSVLPLAGCARGGGAGPGVPAILLDFVVDFGARVDDSSFYFIALDADGDFGADGPLPVAAGPFWGNGWGTGSITHFVSYTQGRYDVYRVNRQLEILARGGGIVGATGSPDETDTGEYELRVGALARGAVTIGGTGPVTGVTNDSDQNAGQFSLETDGQGRTVAGTVGFAPAADGGRALTATEQAALDTLDAGGVTVAADSLAAFGLTLQMGSPAAGVQTLQVAPTVAEVDVAFRPTSSGGTRNSTGTLTANSDSPTATPPIPGAVLTAETLVTGGVTRLRSETSPTATLIGPPYDSQPPGGGSELNVTLDLATLGANLDNLSVNIISSTELIFDPTITDPGQHVYDGLGVQGNDYVTFTVRQSRVIANGDQFTPEACGDPTLLGPATDDERDAVDILDWRITVQKLQ
jgi:hypothetical protein